MTSADHGINLDRLLQLRLAVARFGEMDLAKWWNTTGQLGRLGALALRRGFPRTHRFAQARSVFAVAAQRCAELFAPPNCVTLWRLPETIEEAFDARWESWVDNATAWEPFFLQLESIEASDLLAVLRRLELLSEAEALACGRLRRSAEGRAVPIPGVFRPEDEYVNLLASGFYRGEMGNPAVPYARRSDA